MAAFYDWIYKQERITVEEGIESGTLNDDFQASKEDEKFEMHWIPLLFSKRDTADNYVSTLEFYEIIDYLYKKETMTALINILMKICYLST